MAKDFLDEFDEIDGVEAEQEAEPVAEPQPEPPASEPEPPAAEQPQEVPVTTPIKPEPGFVPFGAVLDERDKRKKLEAEIEELRKRNQQPAEPIAVPDVFEDPEGYRAYQANLAHSQALEVRLDLSEENARDKFGDELVDKARDWALQLFASKPGFQQEVLTQRNPYRFVVEEFQRQEIAKSVTPDDYKQFIAWKEAQAGLQQQPPAQTPPSPQTPPPRSLASAPSAGPAVQDPVLSEEEDFAETFKRK